MDHQQGSNHFWLNPNNALPIIPASVYNPNPDHSPQHFNSTPQANIIPDAFQQPGETYFERLRRKKKQGTTTSSDACDQFYHPHSYAYQPQPQPQPDYLQPRSQAHPTQQQQQQGGHHNMSAAVLPSSQHFTAQLPQSYNRKEYMQSNVQALSSNLTSASNTFAPPPRVATDLSSQKFTPASRPLSRFQQLLHQKLAAEKSAPAPAPTSPAVENHPIEIAFAQAQLDANDTVFHRGFAGRHHVSDESDQNVTKVAVEKPKANPGPSQPSLVQQQQQQHQQVPWHLQQAQRVQMQQQQQMYIDSPSYYSYASPNATFHPSKAQYQTPLLVPRRTSDPQQQSGSLSFDRVAADGMTSRLARTNPGLQPTQNIAASSHNPLIGVAPVTPVHQFRSGERRISANSKIDSHTARQDSVSSASYLSNTSSQASPVNEPIVKIEPQWLEPSGMNGWVPSIQLSTSAATVQPHLQEQRQSGAPSFAWNVSEVRSFDDQTSSYLPRQYDSTPALSPISPNHVMRQYPSTSTSSPVTPTDPTRYAGQVDLPAPYTTIKVEPDSHLNVPYLSHPGTRASNTTTYQSPNSSVTSTSGSPLLDFGHRMFTNFNGSFQLPGTATYMSSTSNGGDMTSTLANGLAGLNGNGNGSSGGNDGTGDWTDGKGNGNGDGSGEASGSGSGSGGNGDDYGNGDDGGDEDDHDGNGTPNGSRKGKKLALACHFCRRRKLKCNGIHPVCDNCTKRNEVCSWDGVVRRRGPGKATRERREKAAREAIAAGLTNSNSLGPRMTFVDPSDPTFVSDDMGVVSVHGNGHGHGQGELPIADAIATLPIDLKGEHHQEHAHEQDHEHQFALQAIASEVVGGLPGSDNGQTGSEGVGMSLGMNDDIPIDPELAALSAAVLPSSNIQNSHGIPGTLAELETKREKQQGQGQKRKSPPASLDAKPRQQAGGRQHGSLTDATGDKRLKVEGNGH